MSISEGFGVQIKYHLKGRMAGKSIMAGEGEIEVFRIPPEEGKCYEHVEATRDVYVRGEGTKYFSRKYFSTNKPKYVGKFIEFKQYGRGDGATYSSFFNRDGEKVEIPHSYDMYTCFIETKCLINEERYAGIKVPNSAKGGSKSLRKTRKLNRKSKKSRGRK